MPCWMHRRPCFKPRCARDPWEAFCKDVSLAVVVVPSIIAAILGFTWQQSVSEGSRYLSFLTSLEQLTLKPDDLHHMNGSQLACNYE